MCYVLIAEESSLLSSALTSIVSHNEGFSVVGVVKNREALLERCKTEKIDILFMNAILNGQSSIDIGREIAKNNAAISIFIISSIKNDLNIKSFIKLGIEDYLNLPLTFSKVGTALTLYKEKNQKYFEDPLINEVFAVIENRDYANIYDCACNIIDRLEETDSKNYGKRLIDVVDGLMHQVEIRCAVKINIKDRFPVEKALAREKIYWKLWLTEILDFALQIEAAYHCHTLQRVFELVERSLYESVKLDKICKECNISEGYLNKKMREFMGVSTMDYVQRRKLLEAKKLLSFRTSMLGDIAYELGYNESSYFSKVFKKYEGIAPIHFRKIVSGRVD